MEVHRARGTVTAQGMALGRGRPLVCEASELAGVSCACRPQVGHKADRRKRATRAAHPVLPRLPPGVRDDEGTKPWISLFMEDAYGPTLRVRDDER